MFNRPDFARQTFEIIRQVRPSALILSADGPREDQPGEAQKVQQTRALIERMVDWPCEVVKLYNDVNYGTQKTIGPHLAQAFNQYERLHYVEDDVLLHPTYFPYAEELLERYAHEPRIMQIGATNNLWGRFPFPYSYGFTKFTLIWGMSTWRRAWDFHKTQTLPPDPQYTLPAIARSHDSDFERDYWARRLNDPSDPLFVASDYNWQFSAWKHDTLSIMPAVNLATNIGFGKGATNTQVLNYSHIIPSKPMQFPLKHPPAIERSIERDRWIFEVTHLYTEARPWHRRWYAFKIAQGAWRKRLLGL